jgi:hypothetical protein
MYMYINIVIVNEDYMWVFFLLNILTEVTML